MANIATRSLSLTSLRVNLEENCFGVPEGAIHFSETNAAGDRLERTRITISVGKEEYCFDSINELFNFIKVGYANK